MDWIIECISYNRLVDTLAFQVQAPSIQIPSFNFADIAKKVDTPIVKEKSSHSVFYGKKLFLSPSLPTEQVSKLATQLAQNNATLVNNMHDADYVVFHSSVNADACTVDDSKQVTAKWVFECCNQKILLQTSRDIRYKPIVVQKQPDALQKPKICLTNIHGDWKAFFQDVIGFLGGIVVKHLDRNVDYLVCEQESNSSTRLMSEKITRAAEWNIPLVQQMQNPIYLADYIGESLLYTSQWSCPKKPN